MRILICVFVAAFCAPVFADFVPLIESFEGRYESADCGFAVRVEVSAAVGALGARFVRAHDASGAIALEREFHLLNGDAWKKSSADAAGTDVATRSRFVCGPKSCKLWNENQFCGHGPEAPCRAWASYQDEVVRLDETSVTLVGGDAEQCVFSRSKP